jgi:hypothetical protein
VPKLDVLAIIRRIVALFGDVPLLLRMAGAWLAITAAFGWVTGALVPPQAPGSFPTVFFVSTALTAALNALAITACAVNVHRFILLQEPPVPLRVSRLEWHYFLRGLWICVPFVVLGVALALALAFIFTSEPSQPLITVGMVVFGVGATFFLVELSLSLPAVAIGQREFKASHGLDASNGNSLRLFLLAALSFAVPWLLEQLVIGGLLFLIRGLPAPLLAGVGLALGSAFSLVQTIVWAAMLSYGYAGLVQRNPAFVVSGPAPAG